MKFKIHNPFAPKMSAEDFAFIGDPHSAYAEVVLVTRNRLKGSEERKKMTIFCDGLHHGGDGIWRSIDDGTPFPVNIREVVMAAVARGRLADQVSGQLAKASGGSGGSSSSTYIPPEANANSKNWGISASKVFSAHRSNMAQNIYMTPDGPKPLTNELIDSLEPLEKYRVQKMLHEQQISEMRKEMAAQMPYPSVAPPSKFY